MKIWVFLNFSEGRPSLAHCMCNETDTSRIKTPLDEGLLVVAWIDRSPIAVTGDVEVHKAPTRQAAIDLARFGIDQWRITGGEQLVVYWGDDPIKAAETLRNCNAVPASESALLR